MMRNPLEGQFTLGVEEEFQIVDGQTWELRSYVSRLLEDGKAILRERVRPEMHQSVVEIGTGVCKSVSEIRGELTEMRVELDRIARQGGMRIVGAGTHPFSDWKSQDITNHDRYHAIVEDMQDVARANLIFGLHVHVGIKEKEVAIQMANQLRYFLPHLLALSTSSPLWLGRASGQHSTRSLLFKRFPRTGIPGVFESYSQFKEYVDLLIKTNTIDNAKKIWWDVRAHYLYDTVEVRICDMPTRLEHSVALAALIQALTAQLYLLYRRNMAWRTYPNALIEENKWRACRYGPHAKLIDCGEQRERPFPELLDELLAFVSEAAALLDTEKELTAVRNILRDGTSADHQLRVFKETHDTRAVVKWLVDETMAGVGHTAGPIQQSA